VRVLAAVAVVVALWPDAVLAAEPADCQVPPDLVQADFDLPHLSERLKAKQPVKIVAIGGASTIGAAAGSPELAYPHRLQVALAQFYPDSPLTVVNKGVPRQSARQMLDRFPTDAIAEDPILVVWEAGISDAVRGLAVEDFAAALQAGIDELKNRAIDIILVDMQFSRSAATVIDFDRYLRTLHQVGELSSVFVFPRFEMMRYWSEQNVFKFDDVSTDERARLAARVYDCVGRNLAQAIRAGVR